MRAVIDTCVVIDALQSREPFARDAEQIILACANRRCVGFITAKAVTDIYYLTHRQTHSDQAARQVLSKLLVLMALADTTEMDVRNALTSEVSDFEDAVMIETALREKTDCIVTRNVRDYTKSPVPVLTPSDFLKRLAEETEIQE